MAIASPIAGGAVRPAGGSAWAERRSSGLVIEMLTVRTGDRISERGAVLVAMPTSMRPGEAGRHARQGGAVQPVAASSARGRRGVGGGDWLRAAVPAAGQHATVAGAPLCGGRRGRSTERAVLRQAIADNQVAVRTTSDGSAPQASSSRVVHLEQLVNVGKLYREVNKASQLLTGVQGHLKPSETEDGVETARRYLEKMVRLAKVIHQDVKRAESSGLLLRVFEGESESVKVVVNAAVEMAERLEATSAKLRALLPEGEQEDGAASAGEAQRKSVEEIVKQLKAFDLQTMQGFAGTLRRVWMRLNGKTDISKPPAGALDLPKPASQKALVALKESELLIQVEELEHLLEVASKARESRLRQKGTLARTRLASEIRQLDDEVNEARKKLAVRTLQLEMERIYGFLESELLDVSSDLRVEGVDDTMVIVLEYGILEKRLDLLRVAVDRDEAIFIEDDVLAQLAQDIPELKNTLGIIDETNAVDLGKKVAVSTREVALKVKEGANFYSRGLKLMASDIQYASKLFVQAVLGTTLKPREVRSLRRTLLDLLTLVPFTIILITPMTPVGHVLVFSFIQRYFPSFFPSPFTNKRQLVMLRYESIREQLARVNDPNSADSEATLAAIAASTGEAITVAQLRELGGSALPLAVLSLDDEEDSGKRAMRQSEVEAREMLAARASGDESKAAATSGRETGGSTASSSSTRKAS